MSEREGQELSAEDDSNETVVGITIGGHHLIFILVLICLVLLLSITVTLVCCLKSQWNNSDQLNTNKRIRKTSSNKSVNISKIHETKQTQTFVPEVRKYIIEQFQLCYFRKDPEFRWGQEAWFSNN